MLCLLCCFGLFLPSLVARGSKLFEPAFRKEVLVHSKAKNGPRIARHCCSLINSSFNEFKEYQILLVSRISARIVKSVCSETKQHSLSTEDRIIWDYGHPPRRQSCYLIARSHQVSSPTGCSCTVSTLICIGTTCTDGRRFQFHLIRFVFCSSS
jgi:hypothetical protein